MYFFAIRIDRCHINAGFFSNHKVVYLIEHVKSHETGVNNFEQLFFQVKKSFLLDR